MYICDCIYTCAYLHVLASMCKRKRDKQRSIESERERYDIYIYIHIQVNIYIDYIIQTMILPTSA